MFLASAIEGDDYILHQLFHEPLLLFIPLLLSVYWLNVVLRAIVWDSTIEDVQNQGSRDRSYSIVQLNIVDLSDLHHQESREVIGHFILKLLLEHLIGVTHTRYRSFWSLGVRVDFLVTVLPFHLIIIIVRSIGPP